MNKKFLNILVCPICKGKLEYRKKQSELICDHDRLAFPIRKGVPILLQMDARPLDASK